MVVVGLWGKEQRMTRGTGHESENACFAAVKAGEIRPGDVVVLRYEGPVGGPGA